MAYFLLGLSHVSIFSSIFFVIILPDFHDRNHSFHNRDNSGRPIGVYKHVYTMYEIV